MKNWFTNILILLAVVAAVFWEAAFNGVRHFLGAQVDLLPSLIVYASLNCSLAIVSVVAVAGGLLLDSLSANPLGISILPLYAVGVGIYVNRELILREQLFAQVVLGAGASVTAPVLTLLLLLTTRQNPLFGWGTLWQLIVMGLGGALATPILFELFALVNRTLGYHRVAELSFRPDREIRRGR